MSSTSSSETYCLWKKISDSALPETHEMKLPILKDLYRLLVFLSLETQRTVKQESDLEACQDSFCKFSDVLFKELEEKFEKCFSTMCNASEHKNLGGCSFCFGLYDAVEVLNFLLRCCMLLLTLILDKKDLILGKGTVLLQILKKVVSVNIPGGTEKHFELENSDFHEASQGDNGFRISAKNFNASLHFAEPINPHFHIKSTILEVLIDELLVHEQLRGLLEKIDLAVSINDYKYYPQFTRGAIGIVMRAVSNHFIITFSNKQVFGDFLVRLFHVRATEIMYPPRAPALGMTASVSLLSSPLMISAPKYLQTHVLSLVSKAMDSVVYTGCAKPDHEQVNCFLSTFEKSVVMYIAHMSGCQRDGYSTCASQSIASKMSHKIAYPSLESYMPADMKDKVENLISELHHYPNLDMHDRLTQKKSDLLSFSISFVKEYQNVYDSSCQDVILSILIGLIHKASEGIDDTFLVPVDGIALQNIFLLASMLKLMSISLLQAIRCLRHSDDSCCLKVLKDFSSCKKYDFILGSIKCFKLLQFSLPLQEDLSDIMSCHSTRHMDSKVMFLHFCGLMSQSFASGHDCLVKGCLLMIMALLNLFVFEEGNLDVLSSMVEVCSESPSARSSHDVKFHKVVAEQNSAFMVASKFQKLRSLHVRKLGNNCVAKETSPSSSPGVGNGERFFECLWNMGQKRSDIEDVVDFVECGDPDEYSAWFRNRQRYLKKKRGQKKVKRWKRNKKRWSETEENRN